MAGMRLIYMKFSKKEICILGAEIIILCCILVGFFAKEQSWSWQSSSFSAPEASEDKKTSTVSSPEMILLPGVYYVSLNYETADDMINAWSVKSQQSSFGGLKSNACMLYSGLNSTGMYIWVTDREKVTVAVTTTSGSKVTVHSVMLSSTQAGSRMNLLIFGTFFLVADFLYIHGRKRKLKLETKQTGFFILLIILAASVPLLTGYEIAGADTIYHLLRIEGIKDGLLSGQFPVRIQPNWLQGYGYATGIFYCDTFLYLPALLRIIGFPVGTCYLLYKGLINILTVLIAYFSFKAMFRDRLAGLLGSALYTLNIYRLLIFYLKDHLGECTAMTFLPLLAFALWKLLGQDTSEKSYRNSWIWLTISVTCIVQCHILTCEMAGLTVLVILLISLKRTLRKRTLLELAKAAVAVICLNLWFMVPFLDYLENEKLIITGADVYTRKIQGHGAAWPLLLGMIQTAGHSDNDISGGMQNEMPFTLGAALLLGSIYLIWLYVYRRQNDVSILDTKDREQTAFRHQIWYLGILGMVFGFLTIAMSSASFPWDKIQNMGWASQHMVSALQYPTRWLEIAAVFFAICSCAVFVIGKMLPARKSLWVYLGVTITVLSIAVSLFFSELLLTSGMYKIYEENAMGNSYLSGREYLPLGTNENLLKAGKVVYTDGIKISSYQKRDLQVSFECTNLSGKDGYVELPLLNYKGYQVKGNSAQSGLLLEDGSNHVVKVKIPTGFSGEIRVAFISPVSWRVAEGVSYAAWLACIYFGIRGYRRQRKWKEKS